MDTCAFLDIIRLPFRARDDRHATANATAAQRILKAVQEPVPRAYALVSDIAIKEWHDNVSAVEGELDAHAGKIKNDIERLVACASVLGFAAGVSRTGWVGAAAFRALSSDLLNAAQVVERDDEITSAACEREILGIGPAKKGKQCLKDCIVAETLLRAVASLRNAGSTGVVVFLTSNTKDFTSGGITPHPDLANDFAKLGINLVLEWHQAAHAMGI